MDVDYEISWSSQKLQINFVGLRHSSYFRDFSMDLKFLHCKIF